MVKIDSLQKMALVDPHITPYFFYWSTQGHLLLATMLHFTTNTATSDDNESQPITPLTQELLPLSLPSLSPPENCPDLELDPNLSPCQQDVSLE